MSGFDNFGNIVWHPLELLCKKYIGKIKYTICENTLVCEILRLKYSFKHFMFWIVSFISVSVNTIKQRQWLRWPKFFILRWYSKIVHNAYNWKKIRKEFQVDRHLRKCFYNFILEFRSTNLGIQEWYGKTLHDIIKRIGLEAA